MADSAARALALLRDGSHFQWYVIPLLLLVMYVYANEVERRNWSLVLAGLAFWLMDWFNEILERPGFSFYQLCSRLGHPRQRELTGYTDRPEYRDLFHVRHYGHRDGQTTPS